MARVGSRAGHSNGVTFKWKDYRIEAPGRYKVMTLATHQFIRRFSCTGCPQA